MGIIQTMAYTTFEHKADLGIRGTGETLAEAFSETAKALFQVQTELKFVKPRRAISFACRADNEEELLVEFLNTLLAQAAIHHLFLCEFRFSRFSSQYLQGEARGEPIDERKHVFHQEVKAATYSQLKVEKTDGYYLAQCIVDV